MLLFGSMWCLPLISDPNSVRAVPGTRSSPLSQPVLNSGRKIVAYFRAVNDLSVFLRVCFGSRCRLSHAFCSIRSWLMLCGECWFFATFWLLCRHWS